MDFLDKKVLVCGLGLSGIASAKLLKEKGAKVTAQDIKTEDKILGIEELTELGIDLYLGKNPDEIVAQQDLIVVSPGIPMDLPFILSSIERGIPVWGEIELAYHFCPCPVIAITGTNGKTTTTSLCGEIIKGFISGTRVVGNIGISFAETVSEFRKADMAVAEISSFQLETIHNFRARVAAILNITPDHLNRHKTVENYAAIKKRIFENQQPTDFAILNYDDKMLRAMAAEIKSNVIFFSRLENLEQGVFVRDGYIVCKLFGMDEKLIKIAELKIPGSHNVENALAAVAISICSGVPTGIIIQGLLSFEGVEHRTEFVREVNRVQFFNDSKATNPDAAMKGVEAMSRPIILIGGGSDKNSDFSDWVKLFENKVRDLVVIGEVTDKIIETCNAYNFSSYHKANSMREAVELAFAKAEKGDCVLLSPACASYDMFDNYEQRGRIFKEIVSGL